jgi:hypothetical protein
MPITHTKVSAIADDPAAAAAGEVLPSDWNADHDIALDAADMVPAGSDTQVQYNDNGALGADAGMTYDEATDYLRLIGGIHLSSGATESNITTDGNAIVMKTNGGIRALAFRYDYMAIQSYGGLKWGDLTSFAFDTTIERDAASVTKTTDGSGNYGSHKARYFKNETRTVATLATAASAGAGAKAFVTDANATTFASIVAAGGANGVPVYSDGTNWRIG